MVSRDTLVHVDSLDLVKAVSRKAFIKAAASELFVDEAFIKRDVGRLAVSEGEGISQAAYALKLLQSDGSGRPGQTPAHSVASPSAGSTLRP